MTSVVAPEDQRALTAAQGVALNIAADAVLEGLDLTEGQVEALLAAAPLAGMSRGWLNDLVSAGAACRDLDTEDWYPPYGNGVRGRTAAKREAERQLAASLCAGCPVQAECLALSFELGPHGTWGVWGGLSEHDRAVLRPLWTQLRTQLAQDTTATAADSSADDAPGELCEGDVRQAVA